MDAAGDTGESDPLQAVADALAAFPADRIVVFAHPQGQRAYLDPEVRASISALALLDDAVLTRGLARLKEDLRSGVWSERNQALLELKTCDFGYRLVIT